MSALATPPGTEKPDSFISSQSNEPLTPKCLPLMDPSPVLDTPIYEMPPLFGIDSDIFSVPQDYNGSPSSTPITGLQSPPSSSAANSPTADDARRALETLKNFFQQAPYNVRRTVLKLIEKLQIQTNPRPIGPCQKDSTASTSRKHEN